MFTAWQVMSLVVDNGDGQNLMPVDSSVSQQLYVALTFCSTQNIVTGYKVQSIFPNRNKDWTTRISHVHMSCPDFIITAHMCRQSKLWSNVYSLKEYVICLNIQTLLLPGTTIHHNCQRFCRRVMTLRHGIMLHGGLRNATAKHRNWSVYRGLVCASWKTCTYSLNYKWLFISYTIKPGLGSHGPCWLKLSQTCEHWVWTHQWDRFKQLETESWIRVIKKYTGR